MEKIEFDGENNITTMCSAANEKVKLIKNIVTKGKSVEIWCRELEKVMVDTCRDFLVKGCQM